jgi:HlyD family secretion protein
MKRILIAVGVLGVAAVTVGVIEARNDRPSTSYRTVTIERGDLEATVSATGTLSAVSTVQVGTQVSGQIQKLYADFNNHVKQGPLIAQLDPTLLEQAVTQSQADLERAKADLAQKQFALDQAQPLYDQKIITLTEYNTAKYNLITSQANLKSSQAGLDRALQNLRYTKIYAPIDGIIVERNVDVGQTVAASLSAPQLFLIAEDLGQMQILAAVDESDIGNISNGQAVRFTVQAYPNREFTGAVRQVRLQSTTSENVVNYTVVVAVPNPDGKLLPGMTATVSFQVAMAAGILKVPNAALRFRPTDEMMAEVRAARTSAGDTTRRVATDSLGQRNRTAGAGATGAQGDRPGPGATTAQRGAGFQRPPNVAQLWYLDDHGQPAVTRVRTGLTDGQFTEVSGQGVREGLAVIAGVTGGDETPASTTSNPFQGQRNASNGPRPGRGGGF